jgi:hypothetical protein
MATNKSQRAPSQISRKLDRSVIEMEVDLERMERCFLHPLDISFDTEKDLGERTNSHIALQLMARNSARQIIFLTDELKIVRPGVGFIWRVFDTYPIGLVWNSLDFLLYLFFRHRRFLYSQAEVAIRDVNTRIGGSSDMATKRLTDYTKRLKCIDVARRQLPDLWALTRD